MHAVLGIYLEARRITILDDLVDTCRAVALGRLIPLRQVHGDRNRLIGKGQVAGLVFLMIGVRQEDR